jgi:hypothetical protein
MILSSRGDKVTRRLYRDNIKSVNVMKFGQIEFDQWLQHSDQLWVFSQLDAPVEKLK